MNGRLLLEATVVGVGEGPYYYPACRQCYSKLIQSLEDATSLSCSKCKRIYSEPEVHQRYRLCLTISDGLSLANVTSFGNLLEPYFGCSASDFHKKYKNKEYDQGEPPIVKSALEYTLIGCSLLFGFKGVLRNAKGNRIRLKDIMGLGHISSLSPHSRTKKDLVAVQILPQCNSHYPIPVIHCLPKFENRFKDDENNFGLTLFDHNSFLPPNDNDPSLPLKENNNNHSGNFECSSSISAFTESSVDFSMTQWTQSGLAVSRISTMSSCNPFQLDIPSNLKQDYKLTLRAQEKDETPVSSRKSSWSVRNWQKKYLNESKSLSSGTEISGSAGICDKTVDFCATPELPRNAKSGMESFELSSSFSMDNDDHSNSSSCTSVKSQYLSNPKDIQLAMAANKLTLRDINRQEDLDFDSLASCIILNEAHVRNGSEDKGLYVTDMPESEDFDLFLAAVGSEMTMSNTSPTEMSLVVPASANEACIKDAYCYSNKCHVKTSLASSICDGVNNSTGLKDNYENTREHNLISFISVSDSGDIDLLQAVADLEQMQLNTKCSRESIRKNKKLAFDVCVEKVMLPTDVIESDEVLKKIDDDENDQVKPQSCLEDNQLSLINLPESEDFDIFIAGANTKDEVSSPKLNSEMKDINACNSFVELEPSIELEKNIELQRKTCVSNNNKMAFNHLPDNASKGFDLLLLQDIEENGVEDLRYSVNKLNHDLFKSDMKKIETFQKAIPLTLSEDKKPTKSGGNDKTQVIHVQSQLLFSESSDGNIDFNNSEDLFYSPIKYCDSSKKRGIICNDIVEKGTQYVRRNDINKAIDVPSQFSFSASGDSIDDFNNSGDLFDSPINYRDSSRKQVMNEDIDFDKNPVRIVLDLRTPNYSRCLFSSQDSSPERDIFSMQSRSNNLKPNRTSTPFIVCRSCLDDSMDLYSS